MEMEAKVYICRESWTLDELRRRIEGVADERETGNCDLQYTYEDDVVRVVAGGRMWSVGAYRIPIIDEHGTITWEDDEGWPHDEDVTDPVLVSAEALEGWTLEDTLDIDVDDEGEEGEVGKCIVFEAIRQALGDEPPEPEMVWTCAKCERRRRVCWECLHTWPDWIGQPVTDVLADRRSDGHDGVRYEVASDGSYIRTVPGDCYDTLVAAKVVLLSDGTLMALPKYDEDGGETEIEPDTLDEGVTVVKEVADWCCVIEK